MISVVIVNYRTPDDLVRLIDGLKAHPPRGAWEAIVVDNASGDDSPARLRAAHPDVALIESPRNGGFAAGVNQGLQAARGEWLLVLNPDIEVRPGSLDTLRDWMEAHPRAGLAASKLIHPDGTLQHTCRRYYTLWTILLRRSILGRLFPQSRAISDHLMLDYDHAEPRVVDWVAGACMMVRRRALEEVGPMDERYFMYFEDVDWCTRMQRRGWEVWYVPASVMVHGYRRASAAGFGRMARTHAGSLIRFWEKYSAVLYLLRRHRETIRNLFLMLADLVAINLAFVAAYAVRQEMATLLAKPPFPFSNYHTFLAVTNVVGVGTFAAAGLYRTSERGDWIDTLFAVGRALVLTCLVLFAITFILDARYSRVIILSFWPLALLLVTLERRVIYNTLETARRERLNVHRVALIGSDAGLDGLARRLRADPGQGWEPVRREALGATETSAAVAWLREERINDVVLGPPSGPEESAAVARLAALLRDSGIHVHFLNPLGGLSMERLRTTRMGDATLLSVAGAEAAPGRRGLRRLLEVAVASTLLIVYLLPALLTGLVLLLLGRRPRSVDRVGADPAGRSVRWREFTADGWGGALLRRWALDRYPGLPPLLSGRISLTAPPGGNGLIRTAEAGSEWTAEDDLKALLRDTLGRLVGRSG